MKLFKTLILSVSLLATGQSFAQEPSITTETYGSWTYRCSQVSKPNADDTAVSKKACELVQVLQDAKGNVIAQLAFGIDAASPEKIVSVMQVPQGALLTVPVVLSDEDKKNTLQAPYFSCFNNICLARTETNKEQLKSFGTSSKGNLEFADRSGRKIRVLLSFEGLSAASERLISTDQQ